MRRRQPLDSMTDFRNRCDPSKTPLSPLKTVYSPVHRWQSLSTTDFPGGREADEEGGRKDGVPES